MAEKTHVESAYNAAMGALTTHLSGLSLVLDSRQMWDLGRVVGNMTNAAHATGRREAFTQAQSEILREARRGEHRAPARVQLTYTGGLRRASKVIEPLLSKAIEIESEQRSKATEA